MRGIIPQRDAVLSSAAMKKLWIIVLASQLFGCAIPFYVQAAGGQLDLLRRRVPIDELLNRPDTSARLQQQLRRAVELRQFAVEMLGLPDNSSYRTYVELDRPSVVWNVVAAEEFSIKPKRWCYPFVGCVSYRGYFRQEAAQRYAERLAGQGLDVYVGGSRAYSTLGFFADPVLSTMLEAGEVALAEILFHELAHQQLYIKGDSAFSEAFATAVAEYGAERWLDSIEGAEAAAGYRRRLCYREDISQLIARQQKRLGQIFSASTSPAAKRIAKAAAYTEMRDDYARLRTGWDGYTGYDLWIESLTNNAALAALATYRYWVGALRYRLDSIGLRAFYSEAAALDKLSDAERREQLESWRSASDQRPACRRNDES
jgi:predicted aminopeptidase